MRHSRGVHSQARESTSAHSAPAPAVLLLVCAPPLVRRASPLSVARTQRRGTSRRRHPPPALRRRLTWTSASPARRASSTRMTGTRGPRRAPPGPRSPARGTSCRGPLRRPARWCPRQRRGRPSVACATAASAGAAPRGCGGSRPSADSGTSLPARRARRRCGILSPVRAHAGSRWLCLCAACMTGLWQGSKDQQQRRLGPEHARTRCQDTDDGTDLCHARRWSHAPDRCLACCARRPGRHARDGAPGHRQGLLPARRQGVRTP